MFLISTKRENINIQFSDPTQLKYHLKDKVPFPVDGYISVTEDLGTIYQSIKYLYVLQRLIN